MTRFIAVLLACTLAACTTPLPKPVNANGSVSPTVTVGDLDLAYQDAAAIATTYAASCHAAPTTPGCNEALIAKAKAASKSANKALHAAHAALKDFPTGGTALDKAIAELQAALTFMQSYTAQIPHAFKETP